MIRNVTSVFISVSVSVVVSVYLMASFQPLVSGIRTLIMLELMMQTTFRNPPIGQTEKPTEQLMQIRGGDLVRILVKRHHRQPLNT